MHYQYLQPTYFIDIPLRSERMFRREQGFACDKVPARDQLGVMYNGPTDKSQSDIGRSAILIQLPGLLSAGGGKMV